MQRNNDTDRTVVVIGAGIVGVLTAYHLLEAGYSVTLVDSKIPGQGSTQRSAACVRAQWGNPNLVRAMRHSIEFYRTFQTRFPNSPPVIDQVGYLYPYWRAHHQEWQVAQDRVRMQQAAGLLSVRLLQPDELLDQFPFVSESREDVGPLLGGPFLPRWRVLWSFQHREWGDGAFAEQLLGPV